MSTLDDSLPTTGPGTDPAVGAKEAARARRLANLRPPFQKGQSGNPSGKNGRDKANEIAAFLDKPESDDSERTRFEAIVSRMCRAALYGDTSAAKLLLEYKLGKPGVLPSALDLAEHMRKVSRDAAELALKVLGTRLYSMTPKELAEFFRECGGNPRAFLDAAENIRDAETVVAEAPTEQPHDPEAKQAPAQRENTTPTTGDESEGWPTE
jgi:hypothetical protein